MQRRITLKCLAPIHHYSLNSTGDEVCGTTFCQKDIQILNELTYEDEGYVCQFLACGHQRWVKIQDKISHLNRNLLWDRLLPFQQDFLTFSEKANLRVLCTDEMGLGKTVEAASLLRENASLFTDNFTKTCLIVVPPGGIFQWENELKEWLGLDNPTSLEHLSLLPQPVIRNGQAFSPFTKVIICPWSKLGDKNTLGQIKAIPGGLGSIIVDEVHLFKDPASRRTKTLIDIIKLLPPTAPMLLLSGTIIENSIKELFVALNALDPTFFSSPRVLEGFCIHSAEGKSLTLSPWMRNRFFQRVSRYWIGRKKLEVNIPLPELKSQKLWFDPTEFKSNNEFLKDYETTMDELEEALAMGPSASQLIALMQQLRHHVGRMKIMACASWAFEWLRSHPGEKLAIGVHHKVVRETLVKLLSQFGAISMSDEAPAEKDELEQKFKNDPSCRVLVCSIIAAGIGRNLQFCKNAIVLERQWNRSKEDQFEQRFWRIVKDPDGRVKKFFQSPQDDVNIYYLMLQDTFDQYFDSLVHLKGIIADSVEEGEEIPDEKFIQKLAETVVRERRRFVG